MSIERLFSNPKDMIRAAEKRMFTEIVDTFKRSHASNGDQPTPLSFTEDRITFVVRLPASLGARSAVWIDVKKAVESMGFSEVSLNDNGYAILYSVTIPE